MATATAKSTLGSIFGMVGTTAGAVSAAVEAGVVGVEMFDRFVQKHSDDQRTRYDLEDGRYKARLVKEMAIEDARQDTEVEKFCAESTEQRASYEKNLAFYTALLEKSEARKGK